jgi:uncharacterized protein involved in exopolysaccharide biosynthesis
MPVNWKLISAFITTARRVVPVCFAVALALTVVMLVREVPVYRSQARLRFPDATAEQTLDTYRIWMNTLVAEVLSGPVLDQAFERTNRSREEIAKYMTRCEAIHVPDTSIVNLQADAIDPVLAADVANAWAQAIIARYATDETKRPDVIDAAKPSYSPVTPRKLRTIQLAAIMGICAGLLISAGVTLATYKR